MPDWLEDVLVVLYYVWLAVFIFFLLPFVDMGGLSLALFAATIVAGVAMKLAGWIPE